MTAPLVKLRKETKAQRAARRARQLRYWHAKAQPAYRAAYDGLLGLLGTRCVWCSQRAEVIDHVAPRTWDPSAVHRNERIARYARDIADGICVPSCHLCNEVRGGLVSQGAPYTIAPNIEPIPF